MSEYVCNICHKELANNKTAILIKMLLLYKYFLDIFITKYSPERLPTAASENIIKYAVSHQYEQYDGISLRNGILQ